MKSIFALLLLSLVGCTTHPSITPYEITMGIMNPKKNVNPEVISQLKGTMEKELEASEYFTIPSKAILKARYEVDGPVPRVDPRGEDESPQQFGTRIFLRSLKMVKRSGIDFGITVFITKDTQHEIIIMLLDTDLILSWGESPSQNRDDFLSSGSVYQESFSSINELDPILKRCVQYFEQEVQKRPNYEGLSEDINRFFPML